MFFLAHHNQCTEPGCQTQAAAPRRQAAQALTVLTTAACHLGRKLKSKRALVIYSLALREVQPFQGHWGHWINPTRTGYSVPGTVLPYGFFRVDGIKNVFSRGGVSRPREGV